VIFRREKAGKNEKLSDEYEEWEQDIVQKKGENLGAIPEGQEKEKGEGEEGEASHRKSIGDQGRMGDGEEETGTTIF